MLAGSLLLGGLLPLSPTARDHWAPSGAWRMPVGDPYTLLTERPVVPGPFFLLRGVEWDGGRASHQGADIGSGASGGFVRAAAAGLVVRAADHGEHGGYGTHVVLAHRLPGGALAYSVYAHLRSASLRVKAGQFVPAGTRLGRVGMTGRATTPHLHFEVRTSEDPSERWELADVVDPLAFVDERLPSHRADTSGIAAYLEWAECASLLPADAQGDDALSREQWWRMLAVSGSGTLLDPAMRGNELRDSLVSAGVLAIETSGLSAAQTMDWSELARDLSRLRQTGPRGGPGPLRKSRHRAICDAQFGFSSPMRHTSELSGRAGRPSLTDAVLLLADLTGPAPEPPKPKQTPAPTASAPVAKRGSARADSVARSSASAGTSARAASSRSGTATSVKAGTAARDTGGRSKPATARADSAYPAKPATASASAARKASPAAARTDSVVQAKPATASASAARKANPAAARTDSAAMAKPAAAKPHTSVRAKPAASRPDSVAGAKPAAARSDSLARSKPAAAKSVPATSTKSAPANPSPAAKAKPSAARSDSLAKPAATSAQPAPAKPDSVARAKAAPAKSDTTAKTKPGAAKSGARASAKPPAAKAKPAATDSVTKAKSASDTARRGGSSADTAKRAAKPAPKPAKPAAAPPARADSARS
jgi:hypothetical protein